MGGYCRLLFHQVLSSLLRSHVPLWVVRGVPASDKAPGQWGPCQRSQRLPERTLRLEVRVGIEAAWTGGPRVGHRALALPVALAFMSPSGIPCLMGHARLHLWPAPAQGLVVAEMGTGSSRPS